MERMERMRTLSRILMTPAAGLLLGLLSSEYACAQFRPGYEPLSEKLPPGYTAEVLARIRQQDAGWLQPVRVELPTEGLVSVHTGSPDPVGAFSTPSQFSVSAGHLYRLKLSDMPEFPGVDLYPSLEILDRLHPPHGSESNYPIPVVFTLQDLQEAVEGRLVTRVVYLENPRSASAVDLLRTETPLTLNPTDNAIQEAGLRGRPMIIVRLGGRTPSEHGAADGFFGTGGGFDAGNAIPANTGVAQLSSRPAVQQRSMVRHRNSTEP